jgi:hypothetical protein
MNWRRYLTILLGTFAGLNAALYLFVLAMNPFGNLRNTVLPHHLIMDTNQRFQYPEIVRSGRYDSLIVGTSTSRLFVPKAFEEIFGGTFANVALDAGTAWEQGQLIDLFLRSNKAPRTLVIAIDHVWCTPDANTARTTALRGFPEWMYDDSGWNDLGYLYNTRAIEIAGRRFAAAALGKPARIGRDGYEVFTPPEATYDAAKAQTKLYGSGPRTVPQPKQPADTPSSAERATWKFPALRWLDRHLTPGRWQKIVLVWPPVHAIAQPGLGTTAGVREADCKAKVAGIAVKHGAAVIDFRVPSSITKTDANYWDPLHYRVGIADRVARGISRALKTGKHDPDGDWTLVTSGQQR